MNSRQKITIVLLLQVVLCSVASAQVVEIPDPNLRAAVRETLELSRGKPLSVDAMLQLTRLDLIDRGIENLAGLEFATTLTWLSIASNPITDLRPISGLTKLETLYMWVTPVSDITALSNLTHLRNFHANSCRIADITPLADLVNLEKLWLAGNRITDVTPLANLSRLEYLEIHHNLIFDHTPLDGLSLTHFKYGDYQLCDEPPRPLQPRLENRSFPSVFAAWGGVGWSPVLNQPHLSDYEQMAQHDLYWCCLQWGHKFRRKENTWELWGAKEPDSMDVLFEKNPNMIYLGGFGWLDPDMDMYPPDSPYWRRDADGNINAEEGGALVDLTHPVVQRDIIQKAVAIANCGLYDGILLDFWGAFRYSPAEGDGLVEIVKGIRANTRDDFLIVGNTNQHIAPATGAYINGLFMESGIPGKLDNPSEGFTVLENTLSWAEKNLRKPRVNALEGRAYPDEPLDSPANLRWMRAVTTLGLTFSDGYILFETDMWEGVHGHWHYWYDFWDADLGQPVGETEQLYQETEGLYIREFTNGWAVYNHSGVAQVVRLHEDVVGVSSRVEGKEHTLPNLDGEIYLRVKPENPADVNGDGVVNIIDLTLVAQAIGTGGAGGDVNGDGVVNVFDLVMVANQF